MLTRRQMLVSGAAAVASLRQMRAAQPENVVTGLAADDDQFLEEVERACFLYFWEQGDGQTGLVKDRCHVRENDSNEAASVASTGFGLTALCIGHEREYQDQAAILARVISCLRFLYEKMPVHRGFYYHFANTKTGARIWDSEVSSIDTAILLCGVITCREHFRRSDVSKWADLVLNRVEWTWLSEDTNLLPHGWRPETGFLPYRWDYYSELMMLYLLGIGASRMPLPKETWNAWNRTAFEYDGYRYLGSFAPLFIHQYSQAWFDFRNKRDRYVDYFKNSITATLVHKKFCLELAAQFPDYSEDLWGITASDSQYGYVAWGGPPAVGPIDGTVVPSAAGGSLPFLPSDTLRVLKNMKARYGEHAWSKYGFVNAFNPLKGWYDADAIGIDTGITMLMAENLRTGFVWKTFMRSREAQRGMDLAGFDYY